MNSASISVIWKDASSTFFDESASSRMTGKWTIMDGNTLLEQVSRLLTPGWKKRAEFGDHSNKAIYLIKIGKKTEAVTCVETALSMYPDDDSARELLRKYKRMTPQTNHVNHVDKKIAQINDVNYGGIRSYSPALKFNSVPIISLGPPSEIDAIIYSQGNNVPSEALLNDLIQRKRISKKDVDIAKELVGLVSVAQNNKRDKKYQRIRIIGERLDKKGGEKRMSNILDVVRCIGGRGRARLLEMYWHGIGTWLG